MSNNKMATLPSVLAVVSFSVCSWMQIFWLLALLILVPSVYSRCGCYRVPNQGYYPAIGQALPSESLEDEGQLSSNRDQSNVHYTVPNFRVIQFHPTYLDFREQPVGMPYVESVVLTNPSDQYSIEVTGITALPPFHSSKFSPRILSPHSNISVDIVFLATLLGNVENTVYIHTSKGNFPLQVFGVGMPNPYRLRAFVNFRLLVNGTFTPYINMYNPFSEPLQVEEMYSSGQDLHLELLGGPGDSIDKLWEIPPYETKPIMKASFVGSTEGSAVRFIRIVPGAPAPKQDVLILPFEFEVSSEPGLYSNVDMLDFGTLRTMDEPKSLNVNVVNFGNKSLQILAIQVEPPNKALSVQFTPMSLKASRKNTKIATVTFTALHATHKRQTSGRLVVLSSDPKIKLEIPFWARVLQGTLAYAVGKTAFYIGGAPAKRMLTLTNTFDFPLVIYSASIDKEHQHIFSISNFSEPVVMPPGKLMSPLAIFFTAKEPYVHISTVLRLYTNASIFTIPVHCYNGKLEYEVDNVDRTILDYGTVGTLENRSLSFRIVNNNPVEVSIKEYHTNFEFARLRLVNVKPLKKGKPVKRSRWMQDNSNQTANNSSSSVQSTEKEGSGGLSIKPSDVALFALDIVAPPQEGRFSGEVTIKTAYETMQIPILLNTVLGSLMSKPKRIKIEKSFPGRTDNYPLSIESTFEYQISLQNVSVYPEDSRLQFLRPNELPKLLPKQKTSIGWVRFDPLHAEQDQCYLCICDHDIGCEEWSKMLALPPDTWEADLTLLEKLRRKWDVIEAKQSSFLNASIIIDTSVIKGYMIPVLASLGWPAVVEQSIKFPATHVGNSTVEELVITNPADVPIVVQVLPLLDYPQPEGGLDLLSDRLILDSFALDLNGHASFFLPELELQKSSVEQQVFKTMVGMEASPKALNMFLAPREKRSVQVGFLPDDEQTKTSVIVVRNNLTVLDLVIVQGRGARSQFQVDGKSPGIKSSVLLIEIQPMHLSDCDKSTPKARVYPSFTVKRSFTASNTGQLPVHVIGMNVNGYECEGYGFRILACEPFILQPNTSRKMDITFTPDFTTSRVMRTLHVLTATGQTLEFTLLATLPHHLLSICADALPRPFWEPYFHIFAAVVMSTVFIVIIFFAYFDSQKYIVHCTFTGSARSTLTAAKTSDAYAAGTVFDLNAIAGVKLRITDKKERVNVDAKAHPKLRATNSGGKSSSQVQQLSDVLPATPAPEERVRTNSDSSSNSSRKSSMTASPAQSTICEEKLLDRSPKNISADSPPSRRSRRRDKPMVEPSRCRGQSEPAEAVEPVIVTEELRDPWERDLIEKVRLERQKQQAKVELVAEEEKTNKKKLQKGKRELQKENSNGSSPDETESTERPIGFTTVESKASGRASKKSLPKGDTLSYHGNGSSIDKLDEIALSGPKPDTASGTSKLLPSVESMPRNKSAFALGKKKLGTRHSEPTSRHDTDRFELSTPTSPHAIAAATVEAALNKTMQNNPSKNKKTKVEKSVSAGSGPVSPNMLSSSSRSSSYSSILGDARSSDVGRSTTPSGLMSDAAPIESKKGSPHRWPYEDSRRSSASSSPKSGLKKKPKEDTSGLESCLRHLGLGHQPVVHDTKCSAPTNSGDSMFHWDTLSMLRASRQQAAAAADSEELLAKAPGSGVPSKRKSDGLVKSILSPDSAEFVPAAVRVSKTVGSNLKSKKMDRNWASVDDGVLESLRPPPGLTRPQQSIWDMESLEILPMRRNVMTDTWNSGARSKVPKSPVLDFADASYSSLLGNSKRGNEVFRAYDLLGTRKEAPLWKDGMNPDVEKDMWSGPSSLASTIWGADPLVSATALASSSLPRSRLGLNLDLNIPPVSEPGASEDGALFNLWSPDVINAPYDGWIEDINKEE